MLSLRQAADPEPENESDISTFSVFGFRTPTLKSIVANMGAPLDYSTTYDDDDQAYSGTYDGTQEETVCRTSIEVLDGAQAGSGSRDITVRCCASFASATC